MNYETVWDVFDPIGLKNSPRPLFNFRVLEIRTGIQNVSFDFSSLRDSENFDETIICISSCINLGPYRLFSSKINLTGMRAKGDHLEQAAGTHSAKFWKKYFSTDLTLFL